MNVWLTYAACCVLALTGARLAGRRILPLDSDRRYQPRHRAGAR